jgi:hypothetical protein
MRGPVLGTEKKMPEVKRASRLILLIGTVAALSPIVFVAVTSLVDNMSFFSAPCGHWGFSNGGTVTVTAGGPCSSAWSTSETIPQVVTRLILVQEGILAASALAVVGILRSNQFLLIVSSFVLILESTVFVVDGLILLTLPPGAFLLWLSVKESWRESKCH